MSMQDTVNFHLFTKKQKTSYHVHQRDKLYVFQNYEKRGLEKIQYLLGVGIELILILWPLYFEQKLPSTFTYIIFQVDQFNKLKLVTRLGDELVTDWLPFDVTGVGELKFLNLESIL